MPKNPHAYLAKQRDKQIESTTRLKSPKNVYTFTLTLPDGSITSYWSGEKTFPEKKKNETTKKIKTQKRGWVKPGFDIDNFKKYFKYKQDV